MRLSFSLPRLARHDRLDVLLVQYTAPRMLPCPVVTIVHDVAFALFPRFFSPMERIWMRRTIPATMRRAAAVVTVSRFSRDEILRLYDLPADRVVVAYDGVDPVFTDGARVPSAIEPPFFLSIGNLQPRKDLGTLIRAYRRLTSSSPEIRERLVIVGQEWVRSEARSLLAETEDLRQAGRIVFTGYIPDGQLVGLLQHATAFAYPSVYEGFGLPPVEALAVGTPALVSDIPVTREILGDAALRLPPSDPAAWAEGLRRIASDPALRTSLSELGRARAALFTWERSAQTMLACLERAAGVDRRDR
jgi:glycosyltransferase involved in cell wall biosynthesis